MERDKGGVGTIKGIYAASFNRGKPRIFSAGLFHWSWDCTPADIWMIAAVEPLLVMDNDGWSSVGTLCMH